MQVADQWGELFFSTGSVISGEGSNTTFCFGPTPNQFQLAGAEWVIHNLADHFYIVADEGGDHDMLLRLLQADINLYGGVIDGVSRLPFDVSIIMFGVLGSWWMAGNPCVIIQRALHRFSHW